MISYKCRQTSSAFYPECLQECLTFLPKRKTLQSAAQRADRLQQKCLQMLQIHFLPTLVRPSVSALIRGRSGTRFLCVKAVLFLVVCLFRLEAASQTEAPKPHKRKRHAPHPGSASAVWRSPAELSGSARTSSSGGKPRQVREGVFAASGWEFQNKSNILQWNKRASKTLKIHLSVL